MDYSNDYYSQLFFNAIVTELVYYDRDKGS